MLHSDRNTPDSGDVLGESRIHQCTLRLQPSQSASGQRVGETQMSPPSFSLFEIATVSSGGDVHRRKYARVV